MGSRSAARSVLVMWLALILGTRIAAAEPVVVIVETADSPTLPALAAQVQLHAGRPISVAIVQDRAETSTTLAARASQIVAEHGATVVVWVAASEGNAASERTFLVFAAGRWPGRALIELVRIDGGTPTGDVERTVALKIAGLLDIVTAPRPIGAALGVPVDRTRVGTWRLDVVSSIVREAGDRGTDGRISAGVDHRWQLGDYSLASGIAAHWQPSGVIDGTAGRVSINELGLDAALTGERAFGNWSLLVRPHVSTSFLLATGASLDGRTGSLDVFSPSVGLDVGARWAVSDTVALVLSVGEDTALIQQRFLVDVVVVADLKHARASLMFGISIPLR